MTPAPIGVQTPRRNTPKLAMQAASVAKIYGQRPEIYGKVSWQALIRLSAPSLSAANRQRFEAAIAAGKVVTGKQIARARGPLKTSRPQRQNDRPAMARYLSLPDGL